MWGEVLWGREGWGGACSGVGTSLPGCRVHGDDAASESPAGSQADLCMGWKGLCFLGSRVGS